MYAQRRLSIFCRSVKVGLLEWYSRGSSGKAFHHLAPGIRVVIVFVGRHIFAGKPVARNDIPFCCLPSWRKKYMSWPCSSFKQSTHVGSKEYLHNRQTWEIIICVQQKNLGKNYSLCSDLQFSTENRDSFTLEKARDSAERLISIKRLALAEKDGVHPRLTPALQIFV